ncbi:flagellar biosynthesis protein FlhB [Phenylobacterium aquaticum]|uniref:flagellar biosynthesis protein FlhB n=1 Tax=Phenylobacterium aquaticum TaxID=1763816 RepID=UPI0026EE7FAA|nr:flagellar biosynthesis protein FlhB [Phenylobacterium aquaticum]
MADDPEDKTEEPSARKLADARAKGDVPKTPDLPQLSSFMAAAAVIAVSGGAMSRNMAVALKPFLEHPEAFSVGGGGRVQVAHQALMAAVPMLAAVLAASVIAGVVGNVAQTGLLWTPGKLAPSFDKLSPMSGLKRLFGLDSMMQFAKSIVKVMLVAWIAWLVMKPHMRDMPGLAAMDPMAILPYLCDILRRLVFSIGGFLLVIAGFDWFWQRQRFMARHRMSKEELKDDYKQTEGDPHVKAKQKQIRIQRSRRRMMAAVPTATVVVMNPTHYAVALKYEAGEGGAPICVAKGLDSLALKIRAVAEEAGVPVIEDPPLARSLYAAVEVDEFIPPKHYEAVAKIIGFIMNGAGLTADAA